MKSSPPRTGKSAAPDERANIRADLDRLEGILSDLKTQYEQYFSGVLPFPPERLHNDMKRQLRALMKAPFRSSAMNYRLRALESRHNTFNTYWQRVLKQKEDGTYVKDVFKAELREKMAAADARAQTPVGAAERGIQALFNTYRSELEKHTGQKHEVDFAAFQKSLLQRAKDFKEKHGVEKLTFKVVVKNGKVTVQVKAKQP
jgi:hypothetical protein